MTAEVAAPSGMEQNFMAIPSRVPAPSTGALCRNNTERLLQLLVASARLCLPEAWKHAARSDRNILAAPHFGPTTVLPHFHPLTFLSQVVLSVDQSPSWLRRL